MAVLVIILFCFINPISTSHWYNLPWPYSYKVQDNMGRQQKDMIKNLCFELLKVSLLKMRQIIEVREDHEKFISFNIGMLMGRIREKYRFMYEQYRGSLDAYHNLTWYHPSSVKYYQPYHFLVALERIHYLETEIDKLVDVMVDEATRDLNSERVMVGQGDPTTTEEMKLAERSQKDIIREAAEKSFMRERFLMKRLGNPVNMTTPKKRFLRNWPVEGSWSLDKYNHDYK